MVIYPDQLKSNFKPKHSKRKLMPITKGRRGRMKSREDSLVNLEIDLRMHNLLKYLRVLILFRIELNYPFLVTKLIELKDVLKSSDAAKFVMTSI